MVQTEHRAMADISYLRDEVGLKSTAIDWERLLTINYRAYRPRGCSVIDVGAHHGMHSRRFLRYLRPRHLVLVEPVSIAVPDWNNVRSGTVAPHLWHNPWEQSYDWTRRAPELSATSSMVLIITAIIDLLLLRCL